MHGNIAAALPPVGGRPPGLQKGRFPNGNRPLLVGILMDGGEAAIYAKYGVPPNPANGGAAYLRQKWRMAPNPANGEAAWLCARYQVRPTVQAGDDCQRREKPPPFLTAGKSRALRGRINMAKRRQPTLPRMIARPRRQKRAKRGFSRSGPSQFSAYSFRKE